MREKTFNACFCELIFFCTSAPFLVFYISAFVSYGEFMRGLFYTFMMLNVHGIIRSYNHSPILKQFLICIFFLFN